jgi:hypothetical protein
MRSSPRFPSYIEVSKTITPTDGSPQVTTKTKERNPSRVLVCDINPQMVEVGKVRAKERGYTENGGKREIQIIIGSNAISRPFDKLGGWRR